MRVQVRVRARVRVPVELQVRVVRCALPAVARVVRLVVRSLILSPFKFWDTVMSRTN